MGPGSATLHAASAARCIASGARNASEARVFNPIIALPHTRSTLPGFMMFCGSSARLMVRMMSSSVFER
ncbi:hypothetical protein M2427_002592 [Bradyrhizobium sp. BR13661]|jgi:hypothetical protein|nr:hypothetical protein [Bradyrhizobium sp. BR13661]